MSLLQKLSELGDNLIAGEVPAGHEVPKILAGIVHYLETGSLEAPERMPSAAVQHELNEDKAEIDRLRVQVEALEAAKAQPPAPAPAPVPPAPEQAQSSPSPVAPPPPSPTPPVGGQAVAPPVPVAPVPPQPPAEQA